MFLVSIVTDNQRQALHEKLAGGWLASRFTTEPQRHAMVMVSESVVEDFINGGNTLNGDYYRYRGDLIKQVLDSPEVKMSRAGKVGFIEIIIAAALSWIVGQILDAIWNNWRHNQDELG
jgi:hypothetical protein